MILYREISDIPQHNWEQLNITGDFKWLVKEGTGVPKDKDVEEAYFDLHDQSIEISGGKAFVEEWKRLIIMKMEYGLQLAGGDQSAINRIEITNNKIKDLMEESKDSDIIKNRLIIQRLWKQPINPREITHLEFLKIKQIVEEEHTPKTEEQDGES